MSKERSLEVRVFPHMPEKSRALRVLVVEDEFLIRWSIAETLAHDGHAVLEAGDGASAIRALTEPAEPIDAVLLDLRLPDSNDLTLLADVRRLAPASAVIMMTAHGSLEMERGAIGLGAYRVMNKPFEMDEMRTLLSEACSLQSE